ncbi:hypothetical protein ONQ97_25530, partial [Salmonella enterica subsp. enterica serovar Virginia]|nr:hypothetical protein [Salmonella enterica subsp. enterica serovar Virginia]
YRNVGAPSNTTNRRAFVDRNYDIVMAYREQASKIRITAMPVSSLSQSLLLNNYPPAKRSIALALWSMTVIVAPICGPILGGYIS